MNHEDCPVIIQDEDNLKQPICASWAPDEILVIGPAQRVRSSSLRDHLFGLIRVDPVLCDMFDIPVIPAKLQQFLPLGVASLIYMKCGCNSVGRRARKVSRKNGVNRGAPGRPA